MKQLVHLLKHDFVLLQRNRIIIISLIITVIYASLFKGLAFLGQSEKILVLVIFNDPALLGFLFVGVLMLFEKNENTIHALAVSPVRISNYILSKSISLTVVSLFCCYAMAIASYGFKFNFLHFTMAVILTSLMFTFLGFIAVAGQSSFNTYFLKAIGIILLLTLPFLGYFEVIPRFWFVLFPTQPAIDLFSLSFSNTFSLNKTIFAYVPAFAWCLISYKYANFQLVKNFKK
jgi:fluoroquinolone transport system permease protein